MEDEAFNDAPVEILVKEIDLAGEGGAIHSITSSLLERSC